MFGYNQIRFRLHLGYAQARLHRRLGRVIGMKTVPPGIALADGGCDYGRGSAVARSGRIYRCLHRAQTSRHVWFASSYPRGRGGVHVASFKVSAWSSSILPKHASTVNAAPAEAYARLDAHGAYIMSFTVV